VGNKLRRGKFVAAAPDDGAADSNGACSGDGEDVAPTAPDCVSISLCVCINLCFLNFVVEEWKGNAIGVREECPT